MKNKMLPIDFLNRLIAIKPHGFLIVLFIAFLNVSFAQNVDLDKRLGAENAKIVEEQIGLYPDKVLTEYVRSIGKRLEAALDDNPFEFNFYVADDPIPNAFALPGGYVYVTRGILSLVTTEDELAGIMAHEIVHVTERHSIKQMRRSILPNMLELPGDIVGKVVNDDLGTLLNMPVTTSNSLFQASYSRKHETESDKKGIELASKAGYNPAVLADILERLSLAVEVLTNEKEKKSYFDSHPYTPDRVNNITKTSSKLNWEEKTKISEDFPAPLDGMLYGSSPKKGLFKEQTFIHPNLNFTITFPEDWETTNQPSTVAAIHKDRQAGIFLGLEDNSKSPEEYAKIFEDEIVKSYDKKPSISEPRLVNNHPGYLISMVDNSGSEPMYIHILWLKMDGHIFKLIGIAPKSLETDLKKTALSLRTLKVDERKTIEMYTLRVVKANKNESLEGLSKRTHNIVNTNITSIINDIDEKEGLDKNQAVKIIVKEKYFK